MESNESPLELAGCRLAVIGIGFRLPQHDTILRFWETLRGGRDVFQPVPRERWDHSRYAPAKTPFCPDGGFLDGIHSFDPTAFGLTPQDAAAMETRQRIMLEATDRALRDAGVLVPSTGVYVSCGENPQNARSFLDDIRRDKVSMRGMLENATNNMVAARLSKAYGFEAGSFVIQAACASSLVAIAQACDALRLRHCEVAIAGGVEITHSPTLYSLFGPNRVLSPSGRCRPYTEVADGFVPGEGAAAVVLKRYEDALRDGDHVYALVCGHGITNDGRSFSAMAPNPAGQSSAARQAFDRAGISPSTIEMIEGHGTATKIGDAVEISAMQSVYKDGKQALTSVKSNFGHCFAAAGALSFCKAALSLYFDTVPPIAHFDKADPRHRIKETGPFPLGELTSFKHRVRRAAINALGIGGTNCHMLLESTEPPTYPDNRSVDALRCFEFSGRTPELLNNELQDIKAALDTTLRDAHPQDLSVNLRRRASVSPQNKLTLVARTVDELRSKLERPPEFQASLRTKPKIIYVCPGPGSFCPKALRALYENPAAAEVLKRCDAIIEDMLGSSIEELSATARDNIAHAQPVVFALSLASAKWLAALGLSPDGVLGHSAGEYAALVLSESSDLETALKALIARGNAMAATPPGRMAALLTKSGTSPTLPSHIEIAAYNASDQWVVSGPPQAIESLITESEASEFIAKPLAIPCAAHSALMDPALPVFSHALEGFTWGTPKKPWFSTLYGKELKRVDNDYLVQQLRSPVLFSDAIKSALDAKFTHFIELGGSAILSAVVQKVAQGAGKTTQTVAVHRFGQGRAGMDEAYEALLNHALIEPLAQDDSAGNKIILAPPRYDRRRFPIAFAEEQADRVSAESQTRFQPGEQAPIRASEYGLFDDHKVNGQPIAPAAWMLDKLIGHSRSLPFTLEGMTITAPLESHKSKFWRKRQEGDALAIESSSNGDSWLAHLRARPSHNHIENTRRDDSFQGTPQGVDIIYRALEEGGLSYGESLKTVKQVSFTDQHLRAELKSETRAPFAMVDPSLLDGAFQALVSFLISSEDRRPMLGFAAKRVTLYKELRDAASVDIQVKLRHPEMLRVDLSLFTTNGEPVLYLEDFTARRVKQETVTVAATDWVDIGHFESNQKPKRVGILGSPELSITLASQFIQAGNQVFGPAEVMTQHGQLVVSQSSMVLLVHPSIEELHYLSSRLERITWLGVVTPDAPIAAMVRSLAAELSLRSQVYLVDESEDLSSLSGLLELPFDMLKRETGWKRPTLRPVQLQRVPLLSYRSAWILGGAGGIGASLAEALAQLKVPVTLSGRRENPPQAVSALINDYPGLIHYQAADITNLESLETTHQTLAANRHEPDLVFHAAGLLRDGLLSSQNPDLIEDMLGPKREGVTHLQKVLKPQNKVRVILIGSLSAWVPSPGQALYSASNRYLSQAAKTWPHPNHQVTTLSFGPWKNVGMVANPQILAKLAAVGLDALSPRQGVEMILRAIEASESELLITKLRVSIETLERALSGRTIKASQPQIPVVASQQRPPADPMSHEAIPPQDSAKDKTQSPLAPPSSSSSLEQVLIEVFGHKTVQNQSETPFSELGIDSLKGVDLTRRLESLLSLKLAPTLLFEAPTLTLLRQELLNTLTVDGSNTPPIVEVRSTEASTQEFQSSGQLAEPGLNLPALIRRSIGPAAAELDDQTPFADIGIDSLAGVEIVRKLESELGQSLPPTLLFEAPNLQMLVRTLEGYTPSANAPSPKPPTTASLPRAIEPTSYPAPIKPKPPEVKVSGSNARPFFVNPKAKSEADVKASATTIPDLPQALNEASLTPSGILAVFNRVKPNLNLDPDTPFSDAGIDSLAGVELVRALEQELGVVLEPTLLFEHPTPRLLLRHLEERRLIEGQATPTQLPPSSPKASAAQANTSRAWRVSQGNEGLSFEFTTLELPPPGINEVQIETQYSGVNFIDLLGRVKLHPALQQLPYTLGHEVGGRITQVGANVQGLSEGDQVVGLIPQGGYATHLNIPFHQLIQIPETISLEKATALLITGLTALVAIEEVGRVGQGDEVLIQASAGATGLACAQFALKRGATVFGTASTPEKRSVLQELHIRPLSYSDLDTAIKPGSLDLIVDSLAGENISNLLPLLRHGGRFVEIGAGAAIPDMKLDPAQLFLKHQTFSGVNVSELMKDPRRSPRLVKRWLEALDSGELTLARVQTFPLEQAPTAHELLQQRKTIGKLLLVNHVA